MSLILFDIVLAIGVWLIVFFGYRSYRVDETRMRYFDLRDDLFKLAEDGVVSFDDPAYKMIRKTINGLIRGTHDLSIPLFWSLDLFNRKEERSGARDYGERLKKALEALPAKSREKLERVIITMHYITLGHMLKRSLLVIALLWVARGIFKAMQTWEEKQEEFRRHQEKRLRLVEADAYDAYNKWRSLSHAH
jgi:hypothetical protein